MEMRLQAMVRECVGRNLVDPAGDNIGTIKAVYVDDRSSQPEWFAVDTGWFGDHVSFVPVHCTDVRGADVQTLYTKDTVKEAPHVEPSGHLTPEEQRELFDYYEVHDVASLRQPASGPATGGAPDAPDLTSPPLTRSEHLRNDTGDRPLSDE